MNSRANKHPLGGSILKSAYLIGSLAFLLLCAAAAALGQGSWDALFGMVGLIAGSWIFAELSGWTKRTIETWGNLGKVLLPDLLAVPRGVFVVGFALALTAILLLLQQFTTR